MQTCASLFAVESLWILTTALYCTNHNQLCFFGSTRRSCSSVAISTITGRPCVLCLHQTFSAPDTLDLQLPEAVTPRCLSHTQTSYAQMARWNHGVPFGRPHLLVARLYTKRLHTERLFTVSSSAVLLPSPIERERPDRVHFITFTVVFYHRVKVSRLAVAS